MNNLQDANATTPTEEQGAILELAFAVGHQVSFLSGLPSLQTESSLSVTTGDRGDEASNQRALTFDSNGKYVIDPPDQLVSQYIEDIRKPGTFLQELEGDIAATELEVVAEVFRGPRRYDPMTDEEPIRIQSNINFGHGEEINGTLLHINGNHYIALDETDENNAEYVDENNKFYAERLKTREDGSCMLDALHIVATGEPISEEKIAELRSTIADAVEPENVKAALVQMIAAELNTGEQPAGLGTATRALIDNDPTLGPVLVQQALEREQKAAEAAEEPLIPLADLGIAELDDEANGKKFLDAKKELLKFRNMLMELGSGDAGKKYSKEIVKAVDDLATLPNPTSRASADKPVGSDAVAQFNGLLNTVAKLLGAIQHEQQQAEADEVIGSPGEEQSWRGIQNPDLISYIQAQRLTADPLVNEKLTTYSGSFGWTNVKGAVGEFFAGKQIAEIAADRTKKNGGERKICSLEIMEGKTSIREIDHVILLKQKKQWMIETVFESKSDADAIPEARQQLTKKIDALKKLSPGQQVFVKEGSRHTEDITNNLVVTEPEKSPIGPADTNKGSRKFSPESSYKLTDSKGQPTTLEKLTDQLAIMWLEEDPARTIANVSFGSGAEKSELNKRPTAEKEEKSQKTKSARAAQPKAATADKQKPTSNAQPTEEKDKKLQKNKGRVKK